VGTLNLGKLSEAEIIFMEAQRDLLAYTDLEEGAPHILIQQAMMRISRGLAAFQEACGNI
jgi:hypothetical protein